MLVDINLLPEKETKNKSLLLLAIIVFIILLFGGIAFYFLNQSYQTKLSLLEQQISTTEQLITIEQEKIDHYEASDSLSDLEATVHWAENYPMKTVPVLNKVTALLPERGFIQSFAYEELGTVGLTVQFETSRDAAFYLNTIQDSDWITEAKMTNLSAVTSFYDRVLGEENEGPDESKLLNEKYIPRYLGEFQVVLNRDLIKAESSSQEGGEEE